jgi:hypothetical protein
MHFHGVVLGSQHEIWSKQHNGKVRGIIFEIDRIDFDYLEQICAERGPLTLDERVRSNLRAIKRLRLFQTYYAYPVLGSNGLPLPYWQPAMEEDLSEANESELILMVRSVADLRESDINLQEVIDFVYDKLYIDSYDAEIGSVRIPGYRSYVAEVKRRVEEHMQKGWNIKPLRLPKELHTLYRLARKHGLEEQLDF